MNVQTERLENHTARLTVTIDDERWTQAKKDSARELSKRYRIPGFRKGKAPYSVMVRYVGEAPIIEDAMERLGNEIYRTALEESGFEPYAPGNFEDFQLEPQPVYVFTVPLQPEVELGDYRAIRLEYQAPEVSDEDVESALREMQQREAEVEDSENPVQAGDRVTVDLHSEFADGPEADDEEADKDTPRKGDEYVHRHDLELNLDPENEPVLPGFVEAMVGAEVDKEHEFELDVPDEEEYTNAAGRKVLFKVTVKKIQTVTLPELNDEFAASITADEDDEDAEPLTLEELRERTRDELQEQAVRDAESKYANDVLDAIVEQATIQYPPVMVDERIHDMINDFDQMLRQQGMDLDTYQQVTGITHDDLHEQYHDDAIQSIKRSLVLGEVMLAEQIKVDTGIVDQRIDEMLAQFGDAAEQLRQFFDTPQQRQSMLNNLLYDRIMERLAKIGKGEPLDEPEESEEQTTVIADDTQPVAEAETVPGEADSADETEIAAEEEQAAAGDADQEVQEEPSDDQSPEETQSETDD